MHGFKCISVEKLKVAEEDTRFYVKMRCLYDLKASGYFYYNNKETVHICIRMLVTLFEDILQAGRLTLIRKIVLSAWTFLFLRRLLRSLFFCSSIFTRSLKYFLHGTYS